MTMTIVHLMQGNVSGLVEDAGQPDPCIFNVQDTETMTMTIVHLMQGNVPGLVEDAANITLAMFRTPRP
jgi:hypothetical protein